MPAPHTELSATDMDDLTPGEIAALQGEDPEAAAAEALAEKSAESIAAERAEERANDRAQDLDEQEESIVAEADKPEPTAEELAAAAAEAAEKAKAAGLPTAEELAALVEEEDAPPAPAAAEPKTVTYKGISEADYKAETTKLNAEKAQGLKDLMDGTIDADAYSAIEAKIAEQRDDLVANRALARANAEAAEQSNAKKMTQFQDSIAALMKSSKGTAVDYNTDVKAQAEFDRASRLIAEDPDLAHLTPQQVCDKAHSTVLALRGIVPSAAATPAAAPTPPTAKKPARETSPPPATLSGLPAAAPNATGNDLRAQFARLEGEEAEEFLERLPRAQREALENGAAV